MKPTRLFIGGLGDGIDEHMLSAKLSNYGSVSDAEVKEKRDFEGNVTFRFAYANIEAPRDQIEKCVSHLNGSLWQGSNLRVEVARESFLDRLKRERAKLQDNQQKSSEPVQYKGPSSSEYVVSDNVHLAYAKEGKKYPRDSEAKLKKKRKNDSLELGLSGDQGKNESTEEPVKVKHKSKKKNEAEEKMMASFKTYSSFWADSDEDEDNKRKEDDDGQTESNQNDYTEEIDAVGVQRERKTSQMEDKRQKWGFPSNASKINKQENGLPNKKMTRYDPTLQEHQQFRLLPSTVNKEMQENEHSRLLPSTVNKEMQENEHSKLLPSTVNKEEEEQAVLKEERGLSAIEQSCLSLLTMFNETQKHSKEELPKEEENIVESSGFSMLTMFNQMRKPESSALQDHKQGLSDEVSAELPMLKNQSFFIGRRDSRILDGINWMMHNVEENVLPEYKAVETDLYDVVRTRSVRAKRELHNKLHSEDKDRRKKWNSKKNIMPVVECQNYDYGWRLAEAKIHEKLMEKAQMEGQTEVEGNTSNRSSRGRLAGQGRPGWGRSDGQGHPGRGRSNGQGRPGRGRSDTHGLPGRGISDGQDRPGWVRSDGQNHQDQDRSDGQDGIDWGKSDGQDRGWGQERGRGRRNFNSWDQGRSNTSDHSQG